jgi:pimeloyl-ACP methyl ester carboxylesterase
MDAIGVTHAHVCGHSYGGGVAQWMILDDRARIDRLALVASGGLGREVMLGLRLATFPVYGPLSHLWRCVLGHP